MKGLLKGLRHISHIFGAAPHPTTVDRPTISAIAAASSLVSPLYARRRQGARNADWLPDGREARRPHRLGRRFSEPPQLGLCSPPRPSSSSAAALRSNPLFSPPQMNEFRSAPLASEPVAAPPPLFPLPGSYGLSV